MANTHHYKFKAMLALPWECAKPLELSEQVVVLGGSWCVLAKRLGDTGSVSLDGSTNPIAVIPQGGANRAASQR